MKLACTTQWIWSPSTTNDIKCAHNVVSSLVIWHNDLVEVEQWVRGVRRGSQKMLIPKLYVQNHPMVLINKVVVVAIVAMGMCDDCCRRLKWILWLDDTSDTLLLHG